MGLEKIAFLASPSDAAQEALAALEARHAGVPIEDADVIVALGGDGFMLQTLHRTMGLGAPIYGMNRGSIGFLMNRFEPDALLERLAEAEVATLHPLRMRAHLDSGAVMELSAINEVSLLRQTRQAAKLRIFIDGVERLGEMICDGALVATPAGSTAYNRSAPGPVLPLGAEVLALTPISPFRPRGWRGALLPRDAVVRIEILEQFKRPVASVADSTEVRDVVEVEVAEERGVEIRLLYDPGHGFQERTLQEQFDL